MPPFGPISRQKLIAYLRQAGFEGPVAGSRHAMMWRESRRVAIPNPHRGEIGRDLLARILRQAEITREEWERL